MAPRERGRERVSPLVGNSRSANVAAVVAASGSSSVW